MTLSKDEFIRYSRHLTLEEIGVVGQERLRNASVLAVGAGGLGSPLLLYLAAAGVGTIGIIDFDIVDTSNLQRQIIHDIDWVDKSKILSAKHRISKLNPYCNVITFDCALESANSLSILHQFDIICDGTDNFQTRYLVNDSCILLNKPYVYGSILRFEGQVSVFNLTKTSPNYRDLVPEPPPAGLVPSCAEGGVMGVLPGIIGTIQATEVIKIITGIGNVLDGRLLLFDALNMTFKEMKLQKFSSYKITKLVDYSNFCNPTNPTNSSNDSNDSIQSINCLKLSQLFNSAPVSIALIDVRSLAERAICSIPNSIHIPLSNLDSSESLKFLNEISQEKDIILYCKLGSRSEKGVQILKNFDIESQSLQGGIIQWIHDVDQTLNSY